MIKTNIGGYTTVTKSYIPKAETGGSAVNGGAVDRTGFLSCLMVVHSGAATGSPTSYTLAAKLQDSATSGGTYADITGAAITALTADNTVALKAVDLSGAKAFIRMVVTVTFVGGTSPTLPVAAEIVLGGKDTLPT